MGVETVKTPTRKRLTRTCVDVAVKNHSGARERHWDTEVPEFYLQITPAGYPSYCLRYSKPNGVKGDFTIGSARRLTPEEARESARSRLAALVLHSTDPVKHRREAREKAALDRASTFAVFAEAWWEERLPSFRGATPRNWGSLLKRHLLPRLGKLPMSEVTPDVIEKVIREIKGVTGKRREAGIKKATDGSRNANAAHTLLKTMFAAAAKRGLCVSNPAQFNKLFDDRPVKRVDALNDERLAKLWHAIDEPVRREHKASAEPRRIALKLAFATLQRPNEITLAHADDFNWEADMWRPHPSRTKTGEQYCVPLTKLSKTLFERAFEISGQKLAFPNPNKEGMSMTADFLCDRFVLIRDKLVERNELDNPDIDAYDLKRYGRTLLRKRLKFSRRPVPASTEWGAVLVRTGQHPEWVKLEVGQA